MRLGPHLIISAPSVKLLGVHLDRELGQFARLARPSRGVAASAMRRLYLGICVPRMLYGAELFLVYSAGRPYPSRAPLSPHRRMSSMCMQISSPSRNWSRRRVSVHYSASPPFRLPTRCTSSSTMRKCFALRTLHHWMTGETAARMDKRNGAGCPGVEGGGNGGGGGGPIGVEGLF
ncbi:hypothetical protein C8R43DRAFT_1033821 [Mycena crocata]|nr:hypothetical protein C8R43DRAFT_1033821 [Mycena crocata]